MRQPRPPACRQRLGSICGIGSVVAGCGSMTSLAGCRPSCPDCPACRSSAVHRLAGCQNRQHRQRENITAEICSSCGHRQDLDEGISFSKRSAFSSSSRLASRQPAPVIPASKLRPKRHHEIHAGFRGRDNASALPACAMQGDLHHLCPPFRRSAPGCADERPACCRTDFSRRTHSRTYWSPISIAPWRSRRRLRCRQTIFGVCFPIASARSAALPFGNMDTVGPKRDLQCVSLRDERGGALSEWPGSPQAESSLVEITGSGLTRLQRHRPAQPSTVLERRRAVSSGAQQRCGSGRFQSGERACS